MIDDVEKLISSGAVVGIESGRSAFENIRDELNNTISKNIPTVTDTLEAAGKWASVNRPLIPLPKHFKQLTILKCFCLFTFWHTILQSCDSVVGAGISNAYSEVNVLLERMSDTVGNHSYRYFDEADYYIREYYKYMYYAGIAVSSVLLLVLMCIVLGLLCGICGKRPDGYGDDCCNKGAGSRFLMM